MTTIASTGNAHRKKRRKKGNRSNYQLQSTEKTKRTQTGDGKNKPTKIEYTQGLVTCIVLI